MVQKGPLAGYVPDFSEYPLAPIPLPRPVPPGISVQALGTFGFELINGELQDALVCAELGIPHNALVYRCMLREPLDWQGYSVEVVGTRAEPTDPPDAPRFVDMFSQENPLTVIAWRRRVYCCGTTSYLEVLWQPETRETIALKGLEWGTTQETLIRVQRGLRLLKAIEVHGGRHHDTRYYSRDQFHARYPGAVADAKKRRGVHINDEDIARAFPVSASTFYRYLRDYGRPSLS